MWIVEAPFREIDDPSKAHTQEYPQQRWLRPSRVYSLGRDSRNDLSLDFDSLSRLRAIALDAGPYSLSDFPDPTELPNLYPLTLTNHSPKDLKLHRGKNSEIIIKPGSSHSIESGDQVPTKNRSDPSFSWIRFHWRPVNICMSPSKRKMIPENYRNTGFFFSESRFPTKEHTHFLPTPLRPTNPVGYALVLGIQLISESWLNDFLHATHVKPPATQQVQPTIFKKADETEDTYQQRFQLVKSIHEAKSQGFSDFEKDFQAAWKKLVPQLNFTGAIRFKNWSEDPIKLDPNPARKTLFSKISMILLANQVDKESQDIEEIVRAGLGSVVTHSSPFDKSSTFPQQLQKLWPPQIQSGHRVVIKTKDYASVYDFGGQVVKEMDDLLQAIYDVDTSQLVEGSEYFELPVDHNHTDDPALAVNAPLLSAPSSRSAGFAVGDCSAFTEPDSPPRALFRRTVSRTDGERMKELLPHSEVADEIEVLQRLARNDNFGDDTMEAIQVEPPVQSTTQVTSTGPDENVCRLGPNPEPQLSSPCSSPPPLKRKARAPGGFSFAKYMNFLGQETVETPQNLDRVMSEDVPNNPPAKRQKLGHCPDDEPSKITGSTSRLDEVDIHSIEGPASKMLRETATQRDNGLKRKADAHLSSGEEDMSSGNNGRNNKPQKKARIQTRRELERSRSDLSAGGEHDHKRETGAHSNTKSPKTSRSHKVDQDEYEGADMGDRYLSVKTTGKRLTEEEVRTNLEFNQLRISKPQIILKTRPIPTRPIGWDEEDQSENELRQMDDWNRKGTKPDSSKSFFKVKYVNLVKKLPVSRYDSEDRSGGDEHLNFKKFKPKNGQTLPQLHTPSQPYARRCMKMETVRLQPSSIDDREHARKSREVSSTQVPTEIHDDDDEMEFESRPKSTAKGKAQSDRAKSVRSGAGSQTTLKLGAKAKDRSTQDERPQRPSRSGKSSAPDPPSESEENSSPRKPPPPTRTLTRPSRTQNQSQRNKRVVSVDTGSDSDGDELAFKGFTRTRSRN
ncbi:hypothetical protein PTTG_11666 [Puccinia triticina 1-1 BBBD Race 1]|uniref:Uncharacterized protein n=1 Tax=Puccinia triticina (isolate 1-1 / race 1 (BBBD)) TaxID=630390 RepID=A0A180GZT6_PUCT1|nr:hypothetical protein PTTG_11666 [Puccinia triticina 1-1 BBBD Race 1]